MTESDRPMPGNPPPPSPEPPHASLSDASICASAIRQSSAAAPDDSETVAAVEEMLGLHRPAPMAETAAGLGPWQASLPPPTPAPSAAAPTEPARGSPDAGRKDAATGKPSDRLPAILTEVRLGERSAPRSGSTVPTARSLADPRPFRAWRSPAGAPPRLRAGFRRFANRRGRLRSSCGNTWREAVGQLK